MAEPVTAYDVLGSLGPGHVNLLGDLVRTPPGRARGQGRGDGSDEDGRPRGGLIENGPGNNPLQAGSVADPDQAAEDLDGGERM